MTGELRVEKDLKEGSINDVFGKLRSRLAALLACAENVGILGTEKIAHTPPKVVMNN